MARTKQNPEENYNKPLAVRIRKLTEQSGLSKVTLAENIGVSRQALNDYCAGNSVPDANNLIKLAKYFRVSADWLLGLTDYENVTDTINLVSAYTGLYPDSIKTLHSFSEKVNTTPENEIALSLVDCIITDSLKDFRDFANFAVGLHNDKGVSEERLEGILIGKISLADISEMYHQKAVAVVTEVAEDILNFYENQSERTRAKRKNPAPARRTPRRDNRAE